MKVAVTGGTGLVGRFIVNGVLSDGHDVTVMTRTPPQPGFWSRLWSGFFTAAKGP